MPTTAINVSTEAKVIVFIYCCLFSDSLSPYAIRIHELRLRGDETPSRLSSECNPVKPYKDESAARNKPYPTKARMNARIRRGTKISSQLMPRCCSKRVVATSQPS